MSNEEDTLGHLDITQDETECVKGIRAMRVLRSGYAKWSMGIWRKWAYCRRVDREDRRVSMRGEWM